MSFELYVACVAATVALVNLPEPNVVIITANSIAYGRKLGLITVAGTSGAMIPQMVLTILGMTGFSGVSWRAF